MLLLFHSKKIRTLSRSPIDFGIKIQTRQCAAKIMCHTPKCVDVLIYNERVPQIYTNKHSHTHTLIRIPPSIDTFTIHEYKLSNQNDDRTTIHSGQRTMHTPLTT